MPHYVAYGVAIAPNYIVLFGKLKEHQLSEQNTEQENRYDTPSRSVVCQ